MTATLPRETRTVNGGAKTQSGKAGANPSDNDAGAKSGKSKGGLFKSKKFLIAVVAVLALAYVGYTMFLAPKPKPALPAAGETVKMDPTTLNLTDGHYLKIALAIQLAKGKATAAAFDTSQAAELTLDEFSDRSVDSLSTNAARQRLTKELLAKLKKAYPDEIFSVFVTQFVTQ